MCSVADIFISYSNQDRERVEPLAEALVAAGFSVWWDRHIRGGSEFYAEIERELLAATSVIVVWSDAALTSKWVRDEAEQARDDGKLIPIVIDDIRPPLGFRQFQSIDFSHWKTASDDKGFETLIAAIQYQLNPDKAPAPDLEGFAQQVKRRRAAQKFVPLSIGAVGLVTIAVAAFIVFGSQQNTRSPEKGRVVVEGFTTLSEDSDLSRFRGGLEEAVARTLALNSIETVSAGTPAAETAELSIETQTSSSST